MKSISKSNLYQIYQIYKALGLSTIHIYALAIIKIMRNARKLKTFAKYQNFPYKIYRLSTKLLFIRDELLN